VIDVDPVTANNMIAKLLTVFMGPLLSRYALQNRRVSTRHPDESGEAGSEGSKSGALAPFSFKRRDGYPTAAPDLSRTPQNRRASKPSS
jgi:hypothetical protein